MRALLSLLLVALVVLPVLSAEDEAWAVHAEVDFFQMTEGGLSEVYLPVDLGEEPATVDGYVQWSWWSWSEQTGSNWPDDDAIYRASNRNISLSSTDDTAYVEQHVLTEEEAVALSGKVRVVSAEDRLRMVAFDISITPLVNLSNHTTLHVVLTENLAEDQHRRQAEHLVREMRPEVAFSVKANTTTDFVSMLPADHLDAAGVNLADSPTGWSYSIAVFGSEAIDNEMARLLALAHGDLPPPSIHDGISQAWTPLLISAITAVIAVSIVVAVRQRERTIPKLRASWNGSESTSTVIVIQAGQQGFQITDWRVSPPWRFKRRPPKLTLAPGASKTLTIDFRDVSSGDCHLEVSIEIEEYGAWKQHLWLRASESDAQRHPEEE